MRYNQLGNTGLFVSEICLGTMTFGGQGFWQVVGTLDQKATTGIVSRSLEAGVNFIDTADVYSRWAPGHRGGESETVIGNWLKRGAKRKRRRRLILAGVWSCQGLWIRTPIWCMRPAAPKSTN